MLTVEHLNLSQYRRTILIFPTMLHSTQARAASILLFDTVSPPFKERMIVLTITAENNYGAVVEETIGLEMIYCDIASNYGDSYSAGSLY